MIELERDGELKKKKEFRSQDVSEIRKYFLFIL